MPPVTYLVISACLSNDGLPLVPDEMSLANVPDTKAAEIDVPVPIVILFVTCEGIDTATPFVSCAQYRRND